MESRLSTSVRLACAVLFLCLTARSVSAQDLQPGRNFPTAALEFGADRSAEIDFGDVDQDGDLDVLVGNGMDGSPEQNRIYINLGGLQAGTEGTFADETLTRLPLLPLERTRDIDFLDLDGDGDLDIVEAADTAFSFGGGVGRFYTNQGGIQGGTLGVWLETTDDNWGALVSVPVGQQILGGDSGPWREFNWEVDAGDLDLDGDLDLTWIAMGPQLGGGRDSRVFLNDGTGVFNELWPWADIDAKTEMTGIDSELVDLDGDLDLDLVIAALDEQTRVYMNNLNDPIGTSAFTDVTQSALIDTGAALIGQATFETEPFDADGDGDFDLWMTNYANNLDRILFNQGPGPQGVTFTVNPPTILGDANIDEQESDLIDYDGDGDLDVITANFAGTNHLYRSSLAQGGLLRYRRTGWDVEPPETPSSGNGGTSLDGEVADLDGDGDPDLVLANDGNQNNRLWFNELGVPDTHAPTFFQVEAVPDKTFPSTSRVIAQVRDNSPWYVIGMYEPTLIWWVDAGPEMSEPMVSQGGQQFMGTIPGGIGIISYRVEVADRAGNVGVSATQSFSQGPSNPWSDLGQGLAGVLGEPDLFGAGALLTGTLGWVELKGAAPNATAVLFMGFFNGAVPFKGGTFVPLHPIAQLGVTTTGWGGDRVSWGFWPPGVPSGTTMVFQYWVVDPTGPEGFAASNAVMAVVP
jgi:hypothetical protein